MMFVVICYLEREPARVYGLFASEADAHKWAGEMGVIDFGDVYEVKGVQEK